MVSLPSEDPARRVADILRAIDRIRAYVADIGGLDALMRDEFLHRDAVERQLLVVSEAAVKLRGQVDILEAEIDWHAIRGMGNVIRHNYDGVEDRVIRHVIAEELNVLKSACERLLLRFNAP